MQLRYLKLEQLPDPFKINVWGCREQLSKDKVKYCLEKGLYKSLPIMADEDHSDTLLHAMRIAYFVQNRTEHEEVVVEEQFTKKEEPYLWVMDGFHSLAASIYLNKNMVVCFFNEEDTYDHK